MSIRHGVQNGGMLDRGDERLGAPDPLHLGLHPPPAHEGLLDLGRVREALRLSGCDIGQGYFFGKPLSFAEFENWYGLSGWAAAATQRDADVA